MSNPDNPYYISPKTVGTAAKALITCTVSGSCPDSATLSVLRSSPGNPFYIADHNLEIYAKKGREYTKTDSLDDVLLSISYKLIISMTN